MPTVDVGLCNFDKFIFGDVVGFPYKKVYVIDKR